MDNEVKTPAPDDDSTDAEVSPTTGPDDATDDDWLGGEWLDGGPDDPGLDDGPADHSPDSGPGSTVTPAQHVDFGDDDAEVIEPFPNGPDGDRARRDALGEILRSEGVDDGAIPSLIDTILDKLLPHDTGQPTDGPQLNNDPNPEPEPAPDPWEAPDPPEPDMPVEIDGVDAIPQIDPIGLVGGGSSSDTREQADARHWHG